MKKLVIFGASIVFLGFYLTFLNDCWSYFSDWTPPSSDVFYSLMITIWHSYPFIVMFLGLILLFVGAKSKTIPGGD